MITLEELVKKEVLNILDEISVPAYQGGEGFKEHLRTRNVIRTIRKRYETFEPKNETMTTLEERVDIVLCDILYSVEVPTWELKAKAEMAILALIETEKKESYKEGVRDGEYIMLDE
jgi:hypothetical protein